MLILQGLLGIRQIGSDNEKMEDFPYMETERMRGTRDLSSQNNRIM